MIDNRTKNVMDLNDIKQEMVKVMLGKYADKELSKQELNKFFKYLDHQQKNNTSKNSFDSRIESLYKAIQRQYIDYTKINAIITALD